MSNFGSFMGIFGPLMSNFGLFMGNFSFKNT
jgi:hypothetical protein